MFDENQDLSGLKDIHLPSDISIFPLAIGWQFIVGVIIFILLLPLIIKIFNKIYTVSVRKNGLKEVLLLDNIDGKKFML